MIETLVTYVSAHTSVKVLKIAATATASGIRTAGSVPNTNSRTTSAPTPPITASTRTLDPPPAPCLLASSSASRPVTSTPIPAGRPARAAARIRSAPLPRSRRAAPGGYTTWNAVCRSRERYIAFPVEKYELVRAPGTAAAARRMAARWRGFAPRRRRVWKTTTSGARAPAPNAASARCPPS